MITCTRKLHFDAAHRIIDHESKCKFLHGHRYVIDVTFEAENLDDLGRVIDFGVIKEKLGDWIDSNWDHNTILNIKDKDLGDIIEKQTNQKIFYMNYNPTAENIARYLFEEVIPELFIKDLIKCRKVLVSETPNCYAEVKC